MHDYQILELIRKLLIDLITATTTLIIIIVIIIIMNNYYNLWLAFYKEPKSRCCKHANIFKLIVRSIKESFGSHFNILPHFQICVASFAAESQ